MLSKKKKKDFKYDMFVIYFLEIDIKKKKDVSENMSQKRDY